MCRKKRQLYSRIDMNADKNCDNENLFLLNQTFTY